jgi:hypothetical protein
MKHRFGKWVIVGIVCLLGGFAAGAGLADPVQFGTRTIEIPPPPSGQYRALAAAFPKVVAAMQAFLPTQLRLVDTYVTNDQYTGLALGTNKRLDRYFQLQVARPLDGVPVSEAQFKQARPGILQGVAQVANQLPRLRDQMTHGNQAVQAQTGHDPGVTLSQPNYLGAFRQTDWGVFYSMKIGVKAADGQPSTVMAMSGSVIDIDGQLMMLNAYCQFSGPQDLQWTRQAISAWADAVRAANAVGKHSS